MKQAEERVKAALVEKETLLKELHHRLKNNLQLVSAMLELEATATDDDRVRAAFQRSQDRIQAMASIHEHLLYRSTAPRQVDMASYLPSLVADLCLAYDSGGIGVEADVADVSLGMELAVPCGLIVNELVTNALKHAFPPGWDGDGKIHVRLRLSPSVEGVIELIVSDNGIGLPDDLDLQQPKRLGLSIVSLLTGQLRGRLELERGQWTTFKVTFNQSAAAEGKER